MRPRALDFSGLLAASILIGSWAATHVHGQQLLVPEPKRTEVVIEDRLVAADPADHIRKVPAKTHVVELKKGKFYRIDMTSSTTSTHRRCVWKTRAARFSPRTRTRAAGLNARIDFRPPADGKYRIQATTYAGGVGNYVITVKEMALVAKSVPRPPKLGGPVPAAQKVALAADKKPLVLDGHLRKLDDARDPVVGQPAHVFEVELEANRRYRIDLRSKQFDAYLRIIDAKERGTGAR